MFIVCDQNDIVQDIATEEVNLSRGYTFDGYKQYDNVKSIDVTIGDKFKDGILTKNVQTRIDMAQAAANEVNIQNKLRAMAIIELTREGSWP